MGIPGFREELGRDPRLTAATERVGEVVGQVAGKLWERETFAQELVTQLEKAGKVLSPGLKMTLYSMNEARKAAFTRPSVQGKPTAQTTAEQQQHIENVADEIGRLLADKTIPRARKEALLDVLTVLEEVDAGKRPFTDLLNATVPQ